MMKKRTLKRRIFALVTCTLVLISALIIPIGAESGAETTIAETPSYTSPIDWSAYPSSNLFDINLIKNSSATVTKENDKVIITGYIAMAHLTNLVNGQTYQFNAKSTRTGERGGGISIEFYNGSGLISGSNIYDENNINPSKKFTVPDGTTKTTFYFYGSGSHSNTSATYTDIMLNVGNVAYPYQPYLPYYFQQAFDDGHSTGYDTGKQDGITEGYENGYSDGEAAGLEEGYGNGYDAGYDQGSEDFTNLYQNASLNIFRAASIELKTHYMSNDGQATSYRLTNVPFLVDSNNVLNFSDISDYALNYIQNLNPSANENNVYIDAIYFTWPKAKDYEGAFSLSKSDEIRYNNSNYSWTTISSSLITGYVEGTAKSCHEHCNLFAHNRILPFPRRNRLLNLMI